ncbi:MAG: hypothetical protein U0Y82_08110 [Thermoleophilia bacterium]
MTTPIRIALVGDHAEHVAAHRAIPQRMAALPAALPADPYWIPTDAVDPPEIARFDAVWVVPGSPYRSEDGAITAIRVAREEGIPFLGTCGGFQHALLEFARNVAGLPEAAHAENDPVAPMRLVELLTCSLVGHEGTVHLDPDSRVAAAVGGTLRTERYRCSYGMAPRFAPRLEAAGMRFSGRDAAGGDRVLELPGHPFFVGTLFQPELAGGAGEVHPLITAMVEAAHARRRAAVPAAG